MTHRQKLVEQERATGEYTTFKASLRAELANLKAAAKRKAKEQSVEANVLYERLQKKVDAGVAAWCAKQGIAAPTSRGGSASVPTSHMSNRSKVSAQQAGTTGRPASPNSSPKKRPTTPQVCSGGS